MKIEALLFDLGKVIINFNFDLVMERFAERSSLSTAELRNVIWDGDWIRRYETGEISSREYHAYLCKAAGLQMDLDEFHASWSAMFLPDLIIPEELLAILKERYPLILVSNTNESHAAYIAANYGVFRHFDHKIFSHEVGAMKPDRRMYEAAIAAAGKPPEALFFTDDREENVDAARRFGIRAHRFTALPALLDAFQQHGVEIGEFLAADYADRKAR